jgi:hypothetical protein
MTKCKNNPDYCSANATEDSGYCFDCAEEMACLLFEATISFGYTPETAATAAQKAWKRATP